MLHCRAMNGFRLVTAAVLLLAVANCDNFSDRMSRLEKQNEELRAEIKKGQATADYDLQAKCSKDARIWFNENWRRDKDTILLDFSNHYNKKENKCFIFVEYPYNNGFGAPSGSAWTNQITLWDIYENIKYGDFAENHYTVYKPSISSSDELIMCEFLGQKCKGIDEFNNLLRPYMNN
jgi:hypothetical protein